MLAVILTAITLFSQSIFQVYVAVSDKQQQQQQYETSTTISHETFKSDITSKEDSVDYKKNSQEKVNNKERNNLNYHHHHKRNEKINEHDRNRRETQDFNDSDGYESSDVLPNVDTLQSEEEAEVSSTPLNYSIMSANC